MKNSKFRLIKWAAAMLVIAVAICPFPSPSIERAGPGDASSTTTHVTLGDHQRPREISIEGLLDLSDAKRFHLDLASLLKREQEGQLGIANENFASDQEIASTRRPGKGGVTNEAGSLWYATRER